MRLRFETARSSMNDHLARARESGIRPAGRAAIGAGRVAIDRRAGSRRHCPLIPHGRSALLRCG